MEQIKKSMNELEDFAEDIVRQFLVFPMRVKRFKEKFEEGFNHNDASEIGLFAYNTISSVRHKEEYKELSSAHVKVLNKLILYILCNKLNYPNGSFRVAYKEANEAFGIPKVKPVLSDEMLGIPRSYKSKELYDKHYEMAQRHLYESRNTNPCQEITLEPPTKREKPMQNLSVYRPVLVGGIDILKASDDTLVQIIRDAKAQIENNLDLAKLIKKFQVKNKELQDVIDLCVAQLDK